MPTFEIKIRLTNVEKQDFETVELARAYAAQRVEKAPPSVEAKMHSIIQIDPPPVDRPCPGCQLKSLPALVLEQPPVDVEIDLPPPTVA